MMTKPTLAAVLMEAHESEIHIEDNRDVEDSRNCVEMPGCPIDLPNNRAIFEPDVAAERGSAAITAIPSYEANLLILNGCTKVSNFENDNTIGNWLPRPLDILLKMEESENHFEKKLDDFPIVTFWVNPNDAKLLPCVMATPPVAGEFIPFVFATDGLLYDINVDAEFSCEPMVKTKRMRSPKPAMLLATT
jgi:hypothetical protein